MRNLDLCNELADIRHYVVAVRAAIGNAKSGLQWDELEALTSVLWDAEDKLKAVEGHVAAAEQEELAKHEAA